MRFAFSVRSIDDKETLLDPRYVKILTNITVKDADRNTSKQKIDHHACTDEDWAQFAPPSETAKSQFKRIKKSKDPSYYCLNMDSDSDSLNIGRSGQGAYERVQFMIVPCNFNGN